ERSPPRRPDRGRRDRCARAVRAAVPGLDRRRRPRLRRVLHPRLLLRVLRRRPGGGPRRGRGVARRPVPRRAVRVGPGRRGRARPVPRPGHRRGAGLGVGAGGLAVAAPAPPRHPQHPRRGPRAAGVAVRRDPEHPHPAGAGARARRAALARRTGTRRRDRPSRSGPLARRARAGRPRL
ncbi:MAG: hypothetical protein AVDCRST_MAG66-2588, partial [uncultured Pseudonocardia sp.]